MIVKLAGIWVNYLLRANPEVSEEEKEVYLYGAECFLNEIIADLLLLITGLVSGHLLEVFLWTVGFTVLRVNLGGYHAPSHFLCIVSSTVMGFFSITANVCWLRFPFLTGILLFASLPVVFLMAPVLHKNRPIPLPEQKKIKVKAVFITLAELVLILLFRRHPSVWTSLTSGLLFAVALGMAGVFLNPREA